MHKPACPKLIQVRTTAVSLSHPLTEAGCMLPSPPLTLQYLSRWFLSHSGGKCIWQCNKPLVPLCVCTAGKTWVQDSSAPYNTAQQPGVPRGFILCCHCLCKLMAGWHRTSPLQSLFAPQGVNYWPGRSCCSDPVCHHGQSPCLAAMSVFLWSYRRCVAASENSKRLSVNN